MTKAAAGDQEPCLNRRAALGATAMMVSGAGLPLGPSELLQPVASAGELPLVPTVELASGLNVSKVNLDKWGGKRVTPFPVPLHLS